MIPAVMPLRTVPIAMVPAAMVPIAAVPLAAAPLAILPLAATVEAATSKLCAHSPKLAHARTAPRLDDTSAGGRLATRDAKLADLAAREAELRVHVSTAIAAIRGMEGEMREHERRVAGRRSSWGR